MNDTGKVTLIHAQNGVGKTNFLNAILWTFYNHTTGKFEQKDKIINAEAEDEGKTSASVHLQSVKLQPNDGKQVLFIGSI